MKFADMIACEKYICSSHQAPGVAKDVCATLYCNVHPKMGKRDAKELLVFLQHLTAGLVSARTDRHGSFGIRPEEKRGLLKKLLEMQTICARVGTKTKRTDRLVARADLVTSFFGRQHYSLATLCEKLLCEAENPRSSMSVSEAALTIQVIDGLLDHLGYHRGTTLGPEADKKMVKESLHLLQYRAKLAVWKMKGASNDVSFK